MGKINIGRVVVGGIVAGIVMDLFGYLVDGLLLAQNWSDDMILIGKSEFSTTQLIEFNLLGIVSGLMAIWIYAAIRPRFGAGVKTAIYAGIAVWIVGILVPNAGFMYVAGLSRSTRRWAVW